MQTVTAMRHAIRTGVDVQHHMTLMSTIGKVNVYDFNLHSGSKGNTLVLFIVTTLPEKEILHRFSRLS
jgi:hypothetical protein